MLDDIIPPEFTQWLWDSDAPLLTGGAENVDTCKASIEAIIATNGCLQDEAGEPGNFVFKIRGTENSYEIPHVDKVSGDEDEVIPNAIHVYLLIFVLSQHVIGASVEATNNAVKAFVEKANAQLKA